MRLALVALVAFAAPAAAFEPTGNPVADAYLAAVEGRGYQNVGVESVARDGGASVIAGLAATGSAGQPVAVDEVRIEGGSVDADNVLSAAALAYRGVRLGDPASQIASVRLEQVVFAPTRDGAPSGLIGEAEAIAIDGVTLNTPDGDVLTLAALDGALEGAGGPEVAGRLTISGLSLPAAALDDETAAQLGGVGLDTLTIDLTGEGRWVRATGATELSQLTMELADVGALTITAGLSGFTEELLEEMRSTSLSVPQQMTMISSIDIAALTVTFEDRGITGALLANAAERAGVAPDVLAAGLVAAVPGALADFAEPAFAATIATALERFLADPGTLRLRIAPAAVLPLSEVIATAVQAPTQLPALLNLEIAAE